MIQARINDTGSTRLAISLPTDIIMDVARAVEPATLEAARAKLAERVGVASGGMGAAFSLGDMRASIGLGNTREKTPESFVQFESMVLQQFVESMLPKDTNAVYGKGMAGDMWQSLLAQQLGEVLAKEGGIGIADQILGDHYFEGETKVALAGVSHGAEKARNDASDLLSSALVQEIQRKLTQSLATGDTSPAVDAERR